MGIDELPLRGVVDQLLQELLGLRLGHAADRAGVAREVEAHAVAVLQSAHQHLGHRLEGLALGLVEVAEAELGARGHQRVLGDQARDPPLGRLR